ncbi:hypothetical protein HGM15179_003502 [Zosterops borbonicus]|uniref:Uncharacterized protein n=1 Tax=Zosterops borbonicus TaxID=364589 RepID=A0A8K1GUI9_9PASS|nr:hypothetical protein HGM15179_003502 [Zosterops borbonicus]
MRVSEENKAAQNRWTGTTHGTEILFALQENKEQNGCGASHTQPRMQLVHLSKQEPSHVATGVWALSGQVLVPSLVKDRSHGNKGIFRVKQFKSQDFLSLDLKIIRNIRLEDIQMRKFAKQYCYLFETDEPKES